MASEPLGTDIDTEKNLGRGPDSFQGRNQRSGVTPGLNLQEQFLFEVEFESLLPDFLTPAPVEGVEVVFKENPGLWLKSADLLRGEPQTLGHMKEAARTAPFPSFGPEGVDPFRPQAGEFMPERIPGWRKAVPEAPE